MLDTLFHNYFKRGNVQMSEIPYIERYNLAEGIKPIGLNKDGSNAYPPQWLCLSATKE